jgi:hypothetical protein
MLRKFPQDFWLQPIVDILCKYFQRGTADMAFSVPKKAFKNQLVFKGLKQGLTLIIPEEKPFSFWLEVLYSQLTEARTFFHGALINVELGARKLIKQRKKT